MIKIYKEGIGKDLVRKVKFELRKEEHRELITAEQAPVNWQVFQTIIRKNGWHRLKRDRDDDSDNEDIKKEFKALKMEVKLLREPKRYNTNFQEKRNENNFENRQYQRTCLICKDRACPGGAEKTACRFHDVLIETGKVRIQNNRFVDEKGNQIHIEAGGLKKMFIDKFNTKSVSFTTNHTTMMPTIPSDDNMLVNAVNSDQPLVHALSILADLGHEKKALDIWNANQMAKTKGRPWTGAKVLQNQNN